MKTFAPVTLDELVSEAELLTRVDRKYVIPAATLGPLTEALDPHTRVLEIDGKRDFGYQSVYFDTPDDFAYRLTAQKRRHRFKLRTRRYLDTGGCYLEVKTKDGRGTTVKRRIEYDDARAAELTREAREYVRAALVEHGPDAAVVDHLRPAMTSRYRRMTLLLPGGSRATLDTELSWTDLAGRTATLPRHVIVESKSAGHATEFDRLLWRFGHRPMGISKFGTGTAALHPSLPHNTWSRVLRDAFHTEQPDTDTRDGELS